jgi:thioredoxin 1
MSDIEDIRQQKREQLQDKIGDGTGAETGPGTETGQGTETEQGAETASATPDEPVHVEGADHLEEITERHDVVLVDFYADWCGPCQQLAPIVEQVAAQSDGAVAKLDIDAHQQLAQQYQVRGVPTMILFADGEPAERVVGLRGTEQLVSLVEQHT